MGPVPSFVMTSARASDCVIGSYRDVTMSSATVEVSGFDLRVDGTPSSISIGCASREGRS
jgi:hypothetical protein